MRKQFGLSLVELMISITLGLILMTGVVKIFVSSKVVFSAQQGLSRIQETGRLAIDFISRDVSTAGHYGCHRPSTVALDQNLQGLPLTIGGLHRSFEEGVRGYASANTLPGGVTLDAPGSTIIPVLPDAFTTANILVVRSAGQTGLILNSSNVTTPTLLSVASTAPPQNNCVGALCVGSAAIVADCFKARVFQVTGLNQVNPTTLNVTHSGIWGGSLPGDYVNNFFSGAELLPLNTTVYFLARRNGNLDTPPSLYQRTNNGPAIELLEGVEQMSIRYAPSDANSVLQNYQLAETITPAQWPTVLSVRVQLLVRSPADNVLSEKQSYTFNGVTPPVNDKRMRQTFSTNITIRNRLNLN